MSPIKFWNLVRKIWPKLDLRIRSLWGLDGAHEGFLSRCKRPFGITETCHVCLNLSSPPVRSPRKGERLSRERKVVLSSSSVILTGKFRTWYFSSTKNMKSLRLIFVPLERTYHEFDPSEISSKVVSSLHNPRIRILRSKPPGRTSRESSSVDKNENNEHRRRKAREICFI